MKTVESLRARLAIGPRGLRSRPLADCEWDERVGDSGPFGNPGLRPVLVLKDNHTGQEDADHSHSFAVHYFRAGSRCSGTGDALAASRDPRSAAGPHAGFH